jgi:hypothetical protein
VIATIRRLMDRLTIDFFKNVRTELPEMYFAPEGIAPGGGLASFYRWISLVHSPLSVKSNVWTGGAFRAALNCLSGRFILTAEEFRSVSSSVSCSPASI